MDSVRGRGRGRPGGVIGHAQRRRQPNSDRVKVLRCEYVVRVLQMDAEEVLHESHISSIRKIYSSVFSTIHPSSYSKGLC
ncbi:hypothetical protein F2P79_006214 [Pimephales promelas]|nr:hypothetical protein F2P79_006214 [Pimephales promelas]